MTIARSTVGINKAEDSGTIYLKSCAHPWQTSVQSRTMGLQAERDDAMRCPIIFALLPVLTSFG